MEKQENMRRLPLGVSDFRQLRESDYYFVDKTQYIKRMEEYGDFLFFTRPRRFGKSLFISMMMEYYDLLAQNRFEREFKGTWIYSHPTPERGKYQILFFNYSLVGGDFSNVEENFNKYCGNRINRFIQDYANFYDKTIIEAVMTETSASQKLNIVADAAKSAGHKLYIIVDEYDNFTNSILASRGTGEYRNITHGTGFFRDFMKIFKANATRSLLVGVSPITLDDLSSGANNYTNITTDPTFNMALGFSQNDVEEMIRYYQSRGVIKRSVEDIIEEIKPWYDNYCFSPDRFGVDSMMFNSDMVLYYLNALIRTGKSPENMLDSNTRTDYGKMKMLIGLDRWDGNRGAITQKIVDEGFIYSQISESFPAEDVVKPELFPSLLYYYGMLTIGGKIGDSMKLVIPNRNVMVQYYQYILEHQQETNHLDVGWLREAILGAAIWGDWRTLMEYLTKHYKEDTSVRDTNAGEKGLQMYMNAYLHLSRLFIVRPEVELHRGFSDLLLFGDHSKYSDVKHSYIIELKYLKTNASQAEAERQWQEAVEQVLRYGADEQVLRLTANTTLHLIVLQMKGAEMLKMEEIEQA